MREDGVEIPQTRDFEALRVDPEWAESFADAAMVLAIEPSWAKQRQAAE
jgi:hypothetical protein